MSSRREHIKVLEGFRTNWFWEAFMDGLGPIVDDAQAAVNDLNRVGARHEEDRIRLHLLHQIQSGELVDLARLRLEQQEQRNEEKGERDTSSNITWGRQ